MVAIAAVVVVVVVTSGPNAPTTGFVPTGSSPEQDAQEITTAFLQAWRTGDLNQAARYTDRPAAAQAALVTYRNNLHLRKLAGTPQSAVPVPGGGTRESVAFALNATVASADGPGALHGTWSYHSKLTAYAKPNSNLWYIAWAPDVLAPNLTTSTHLAAIKVAPQVAGVSDASGNDITSYKDAGLTNIANLMEKQAPPGQGTPGLYVEIQNTAGKPVENSQAVVIAPNNIANLTTTIDPTAEAAARAAVAMHPKSSMVAIQPSTGKILAIANNAGFNDYALTAKVAPGSTMKVITSTALISSGALSASSAVACPPAYTVQGITYHNDNNESLPAGTPFVTDFAQSCNNAFSMQWPHLSGGGLANAAKKYFGLNQPWNIGITGVSGTYFNAPASASGSELAQEAFGEGQLTATPLAMASVAATVSNGTFKQPILLPGTKQLTATPLPSGTVGQLKADDAGRGHQRDRRRGRVRSRDLRQDRDRRHPGPGAAEQLAHRLQPGQGRRGGLPGGQRRIRRPVRRPGGEGLPRQVLGQPRRHDADDTVPTNQAAWVSALSAAASRPGCSTKSCHMPGHLV